MPQLITIFGTIGGEVTADAVKSRLDTFDRSQPIHLEISSDGGSVSEGITIYNLVRTWPAGVTVEIVGWALSMATVIASAGRPIRAHETSLLMYHKPWSKTQGNADALRESATVLDQVAETMLLAYGSRAGVGPQKAKSLLDGKDHWFTAEEAMAYGLIDEIIPASTRAAALVDVYACPYPVPSALAQRIAMPIENKPQNTPDADALRAEGVRAEVARCADIRAAFHPYAARDGVSALLASCVKDPAITVDRAKGDLLALLARGATPVAGHYYPSSGAADEQMAEFRQAAVDVLLARAGIPVDEPHPAARDLRSMGVVGMAERILSMTGKSIAGMSKADVVNASLSTSDFPNLLSAVTGKALRIGYAEAPATHKEWTGEREVPDFKPTTLLALSEAPALLPVSELAEYTNGAFSDSASNFVIGTSGRIVSISRQALVNDDTGAFTNIPFALGAAARRKEADTVYGLLTANATLSDSIALFHADHGNLASVPAVLSVAALGLARAGMRQQRGIAGVEYIDPQPRFLIVPVALETTAEQLLASLVDPAKSNDTANTAWIRGLTLVADPRLDAASTTAWYLAASPRQIETIVRAYLAGAERPYLEEEQEFRRDAMSWKARLDFGAGVIDFRGLYKNAGA